MTSRPLGLFDQEIRQRKLEALGDALVELNRIVPWGMFREALETMRPARDPRKGQMIDASIMQKPRTRRPAVAKDGVPLTRQQAARRDDEAHWTQKHERLWFDDKNHLNADVERLPPRRRGDAGGDP